MEFVSKKNAGLAIVTCMMTVSVTIVTVQAVCSTMPFDNVTAELGQVDTAVNVPIYNGTARSMAHCWEVCSRVALCSFINVNATTHTCLLFEGNVADIERTASETWLAMPFPLSEKTRYGCITNDCEAGTQCINTNTGPICATLPA